MVEETQETPTEAASAPVEATLTPTEDQTSVATESTETSVDGEGEQSTEADAPEPMKITLPEDVDESVTAIAGEYASELTKFLGENRDATPAQIAQFSVDFQLAATGKEAEAIQTTIAGWTEASKNDPEFGGDMLNENLAIAQGAVDAYVTQPLQNILHAEGLMQHPEVIRTFLKIGKDISDGKVEPGSAKVMPFDPLKARYK